jgi:hypothetical protein
VRYIIELHVVGLRKELSANPYGPHLGKLTKVDFQQVDCYVALASRLVNIADMESISADATDQLVAMRAKQAPRTA